MWTFRIVNMYLASLCKRKTVEPRTSCATGSEVHVMEIDIHRMPSMLPGRHDGLLAICLHGKGLQTHIARKGIRRLFDGAMRALPAGIAISSFTRAWARLRKK